MNKVDVKEDAGGSKKVVKSAKRLRAKGRVA